MQRIGFVQLSGFGAIVLADFRLCSVQLADFSKGKLGIVELAGS